MEGSLVLNGHCVVKYCCSQLLGFHHAYEATKLCLGGAFRGIGHTQQCTELIHGFCAPGGAWDTLCDVWDPTGVSCMYLSSCTVSLGPEQDLNPSPPEYEGMWECSANIFWRSPLKSVFNVTSVAQTNINGKIRDHAGGGRYHWQQSLTFTEGGEKVLFP